MIAFARLIRSLAAAAVLLALIATGAARAQGWPAPEGYPVDDRAGVIPTAVATGLNARLADLHAGTGIEIAVVTLPSRAGLPPAPTLADFAREFFNARGIGTAARNDGILILLVIDERALQITLGRGYHSGYDVIAQDIVSRRMLPDLRAGDLAAALAAGVDQTITRIARRHAEGLAPEAPPPATGRGLWPALALAGIATLAFLRRRRKRRGRQDDDPARPAGDRDADRPDARSRDDREPGSRRQDDRRNPARGDDDGDDGGGGGGGRSSGGGAGGRW